MVKIMETPIKMDDLRGFPPIFGNTLYLIFKRPDLWIRFRWKRLDSLKGWDGWPVGFQKGFGWSQLANDPGDQLGISWQEYGKAKL